VVDDDQGVRAALCNLLDSAGYRGCGFAAAEEFLASACLRRAACAIVDIELARMSGFELLEHLAQARPGLPVIFVSAHCGAADLRRAAELGAAALLAKPVDADTLLAHVRTAMAASGTGA
jgi:FixJ family two-component response regulator